MLEGGKRWGRGSVQSRKIFVFINSSVSQRRCLNKVRSSIIHIKSDDVRCLGSSPFLTLKVQRLVLSYIVLQGKDHY